MDDNIEEIFNKWLESKDTSENIIDHLKSQKAFHLEFAKIYHISKIHAISNIAIMVKEPESSYFQNGWNSLKNRLINDL